MNPVLAKLFSTPANVIVLDEPTNDLDMETIEILEAALVSFKGTILLVSHDRAFLNNIVTAVFGFEDDGSIKDIVGGYDEWRAYLASKQAPAAATSAPKSAQAPKTAPRTKLTNKERQELEDIPKLIAAHEEEQHDIAQKLQSADFIIKNPDKIEQLQARSREIELEDERLFERWSQLDARNQKK